MLGQERSLLVTGGAGFVGSHTTVQLLKQGYRVIVLDNLSNSYEESIQRIAKLFFGKDSDPSTQSKVVFYHVDLRNREMLLKIFTVHFKEIWGVVHLAGLKSIPDSISNPIRYYDNNVVGTINLLHCMQVFNITNIIFSSSASVYGIPKELPISESCKFAAISTYGETKIVQEQLLTNLSKNFKWSVVILRYFNPSGAHESGRLGEHPKDAKLTNLIPLLAQVALGKRADVPIFGNQYGTLDGTAIRDYIHVMDLANGHVAAIDKFDTRELYIYNLGMGQGHSVLEVLQAFQKACNRPIPYHFEKERPGDPPVLIANVNKATKELHWKTEKSLNDICEDYWRWLTLNPDVMAKI